MDVIFEPIGAATGASLDQIKLIACLLVSYPLGSIFIRLPLTNHTYKHLFNIAVSFFFFVPMLNLHWGLAQLLLDVLATYIITARVKSRNMPWIIFGFTMGHLLINHIIRAVYNLSYETIEITGPQMVLTMKLTTFAWNIHDGRRPPSPDQWQARTRLPTHPSLLAFLGYAFYFPGVLVGPYLDFQAYTALVDGTLYQRDAKEAGVSTFDTRDVPIRSGTLDGAAQALEKQVARIVPSGRKRVAYRRLIVGLAFLGAYVVFGGQFNYGVAVEPWFTKQSLTYRLMYYQVCGFIERAKYYALWTLTEGAAIFTGLGYTGPGRWDGAANVHVLRIEWPSNFKTLLDSWNCNTNIWLRECVYKRVTPPGKKPGFRSSMMTFGTSALWHGVAPGYYLTFIFAGFVTSAGRLARANLRPLFLGTPLEPVYGVLGRLTALGVLNFTTGPFMLSSISRSLTAWRNLGWYGFYPVFGGLLFFHAGGTALCRRMHPTPLVAPKNGTANGNGTLAVPPVPTEKKAR